MDIDETNQQELLSYETPIIIEEEFKDEIQNCGKWFERRMVMRAIFVLLSMFILYVLQTLIMKYSIVVLFTDFDHSLVILFSSVLQMIFCFIVILLTDKYTPLKKMVLSTIKSSYQVIPYVILESMILHCLFYTMKFITLSSSLFTFDLQFIIVFIALVAKNIILGNLSLKKTTILVSCVILSIASVFLMWKYPDGTFAFHSTNKSGVFYIGIFICVLNALKILFVSNNKTPFLTANLQIGVFMSILWGIYTLIYFVVSDYSINSYLTISNVTYLISVLSILLFCERICSFLVIRHYGAILLTLGYPLINGILKLTTSLITGLHVSLLLTLQTIFGTFLSFLSLICFFLFGLIYKYRQRWNKKLNCDDILGISQGVVLFNKSSQAIRVLLSVITLLLITTCLKMVIEFEILKPAKHFSSDYLPVFPWYNFVKYEHNPILLSQGTGFESMAVFNPTAIVENDTIYMFYRAENWGRENWVPETRRPLIWTEDMEWPGISVIGLATSTDGIHFDTRDHPILIPEHEYESVGGLEDPRITKIGSTFFLTYTGVGGNSRINSLCLATSTNLLDWQKHGPMFEFGSKAGAILPNITNGQYYMYFGSKEISLATSSDGLNWTVNRSNLLTPREGFFDELLCEVGPSPILTNNEIILIYNGATKGVDTRIGRYTKVTRSNGVFRTYSTGIAVFDRNDPSKLLYRSNIPFLNVTEEFEKRGQVDNVVFVSGVVKYDSQWFMYYGCADTYIGVAISD